MSVSKILIRVILSLAAVCAIGALSDAGSATSLNKAVTAGVTAADTPTVTSDGNVWHG